MSDYHFDFHIQGERAEHHIKHVAIPCVATRSTSGLKVSGVAQLQADHSESATSVLKSLAVFERRVGCREIRAETSGWAICDHLFRSKTINEKVV